VSSRNYNAEYKDGARKYAYQFDTLLRRYMMRTLDPFLLPGKALEMGCYKGDVTEMLAARYGDLTVVEASEELLEATRARVGERAVFRLGTFETIEMADRYDAVFLMHTLEHLDDAVLVLRRVNDWLSERGRLFIVVPNANAPSRQIAVQMGLIEFNSAITDAERAHGHRRTYSLDTLERDVVGSGLRVLHRGGIFFKPLANYQFDRLMGGDIVTDEYLEGCYGLGMHYPDLCASIYVVCEKGISRA
jgi:2-polyprenyl-3-methyl-5-hydroxy-6-metoxy-1,4-benzoquinol methylase